MQTLLRADRHDFIGFLVRVEKPNNKDTWSVQAGASGGGCQGPLRP